jgi:hypothetical protein
MPDKIRLCAPTYKRSAFGSLRAGRFLVYPVAIAAILRARPEGV